MCNPIIVKLKGRDSESGDREGCEGEVGCSELLKLLGGLGEEGA